MYNFKIETYLKIIFLICLTSLISAFFIEYILGHQPCNLCLIERVPYGLGILLIIFNFAFSRNEQFVILLLTLVFAFSSIISFYHFGVEQGFLKESPICGLKNASDILKNDQKIDVVVLDVSSKDKRISLGLKQNEEDPWEKIDDIFQVDMKIRGKVLFVLDKGIIFLLENGFEAILPISKVEENDKDLFSINKDFDLLVNQINKENRKIVLSYNNNEPASEIEKSDDES